MSYDRERVAAYFNDQRQTEWDRLGSTVNGRIRHAIHRRYLHEALNSVGTENPTVLDVGSGPGRFAIDAAQLGSKVMVTDVSQGQIDEAAVRIEEAGLADRMLGYGVHDVLDLSAFDDASFDVVVCFGGAVSYVREQYPRALRELFRVARERVLVSVMTVHGALRLAGALDASEVFEQPDVTLPWQQILEGEPVIYSRNAEEWHLPLVLFTSDGLCSAVEDAGGSVVSLATANPLVGERILTPNIDVNSAAERNLTDLEVAMSSHPGLVDAGEHLIAVIEPLQGT